MDVLIIRGNNDVTPLWQLLDVLPIFAGNELGPQVKIRSTRHLSYYSVPTPPPHQTQCSPDWTHLPHQTQCSPDWTLCT